MRSPHALQHPARPAAPPGSLRGYRGHPRSCSPPGRSADRPSPELPHTRNAPRRSHRRRRRRGGETCGEPGTCRRRQFRFSGLPAFKPGPDFAEIASLRPRLAPPAGTGGSRSRHGHRAGTGQGGSAPAPTRAPAGTGTAARRGEPAPDKRDRQWGGGPAPGGRGTKGSGHQHPGRQKPVPVPVAAPAGQHHPHRAAGRTGAPGGTSLTPRSRPTPASPLTGGRVSPRSCLPQVQRGRSRGRCSPAAGPDSPRSGSVQRRERRHRSFK